jgi:uncharacterized protein YrrD
MQFREGARVVTADGEKAGAIDRVVLDPDTKEVTHVVVHKGFLFTEEKVVPLSLVGQATDDKITLRLNADDLEALPDFEMAHYVAAPGDTSPVRSASAHWARPLYWYPPVGSTWPVAAFVGAEEPRYVLRTEQNIPEGAVALEEGARVLASDGKYVGDVERVFTDPLDDRVTHLVVSEGLFLKERKLVPATWLSLVFEDQVSLRVDSDFVSSLPEYQLED